MKILHVSFHNGCIGDLNYVAYKLGLDISTLKATWNYNIGHDRAKSIWEEHKEYFNSFDTIITSDTAPLSRIFLQNGYSGKLIIWICNRFDYADIATNDCGFPDPEYYNILRNNLDNPNVKFAAYTPFEYIYARQRGLMVGDLTIKPVAGITQRKAISTIPENIIKKELFFIPPYHNDTIYMNLKQHCELLGIKCYSGRYQGPMDIADFKGVIHIPYAWSNLALFEAIHLGLPYLIPSLKFIVELSRQGNFFWSPPFQVADLMHSEWYCDDFKSVLTYFNSWEDLKEKALNFKSEKLYEEMKVLSAFHEKTELNKWRKILDV